MPRLSQRTREERPAGGLLVGFASFNLVEGVVNHFLLGLHHVREGADDFLYDAGFLLLSALLFVAGSANLRASLDQRQARSDPGGG